MIYEKRFDLIERLIIDFMGICPQKNEEYCDSVMCAGCACLDRNISYEIDKMYDQCFNCNGLGQKSEFTLAFTSVTKICNVCAGTGNIIYSFER